MVESVVCGDAGIAGADVFVYMCLFICACLYVLVYMCLACLYVSCVFIYVCVYVRTYMLFTCVRVLVCM